MEENKDELIPVPETDTVETAAEKVTEAVKETVTEAVTETAALTETVKETVSEVEEDDFADELLEMEHEEADNEIIEGLGESINKQVALEIDPLVPEEPAGGPDGSGFFKKIPKWAYITGGIVLFIVLLVVILNVSGLGVKIVSWFIDRNVRHEEIDANVSPVPTLPEDDIDKFKNLLKPIPTSATTPTPEPTAVPLKFEKTIMNILLIGVENVDPVTGESLTGKTTSRGRTDTIVLMTINSEDKTVKLTSFMRDCYVSIPGKESNRINAAYAKGGVALLYDTIKENFGIVPDNYVLVNFEDFRTIVDSIGGIDIKLSKKEADYLNKTNYISDPKNRNVQEGLNHMNGDQALGYSRVRHVATKENEKSDFGRTDRHREVIRAIIDQLKKLGYLDLFKFGLECLPLVTTDADAETIEKYLNMVVDIGVNNVELEDFRIPQDGTYNYLTVDKMSVLQIDIAKNRDLLWKFIYGESEEEVKKKQQQ